MVPREAYKRVLAEKSQLESTSSSTWQELQEAQKAVARQQQEKAQLEAQLVAAYKTQKEQEAQREQAEKRSQDAERIIARHDTLTARAERGVSLWKTGSAFLFVLAVVLLFVGAAFGSATRKEVTRERAA